MEVMGYNMLQRMREYCGSCGGSIVKPFAHGAEPVCYAHGLRIMVSA
jgi:hypothetical protein